MCIRWYWELYFAKLPWYDLLARLSYYSWRSISSFQRYLHINLLGCGLKLLWKSNDIRKSNGKVKYKWINYLICILRENSRGDVNFILNKISLQIAFSFFPVNISKKYAIKVLELWMDADTFAFHAKFYAILLI